MGEIRTHCLRKEYGSLAALEGLDLVIPQGAIYGIIGPNGAGKTTLLRILATLEQPTYGSATIDGVDVTAHPKEIHSKVGFMPDFYNLYDDMCVRDFLDYFALAFHLRPAAHRDRRVKEVLGLTNLASKATARIAHLSRGMKQRICLARALLHDPQVLLLDEPASGLDPMARIQLRDLLRSLRTQGKTILISSHILADLEDLCSWIGVIERGVLLESAPIAEFGKKVRKGARMRVRVIDGLTRAYSIISATEGVSAALLDADSVSFVHDGPPERMADLHAALVREGVKVIAFAPEKMDLEFVFTRIASHEVA